MTAPSFRDPRSERIYRRLLQLGKGPAAFFADAYRLVEDNLPLDTRSHMLGHALRELESSVRSVLAAATGAPSGKHDDGTNVTVADIVHHVVSELGLPTDGSIAGGWLRTTSSLHGIAHRRNLLPPRSSDHGLGETWLTMISVLDELLDRFETRYADVFARLDRLAEIANPTAVDLDEFAKTIPHTEATLHHFFGRLASPGWFPGLLKRGVFEYHPAPDEDPEQGTIRFPNWAVATYLKRIASDFPSEISKIIATLETDNLRVQEQAIEVAAELPVEQAALLVPAIQCWIPGMRRFRFFGDSVMVLIERLAAAGEGEAVKELLGVMLAPQELEEGEGADTPRWTLEEVPYYLERRAKDLFDKVARCIGVSIVHLLGEPLEQRLRSEREHEPGMSQEEEADESLGLIDHSTTWLPHLRSESPRRIGEMSGFLAFHLRRVLDELARQDAKPAEIVAELRRRATMIFRRIELDFLASYAQAARELVKTVLLDPRFFTESEIRAEHASLMVAAFGFLDDDEKDQVFSWIAAGRDYSWVENEEQRRVWSEFWERDWLAALEVHLSDPRRDRMRQLIEKHGEPRNIQTNESAVSFWSGPSSPIEQADIAGMPVDEILEFLGSWTAHGSPMAASPEGLARSLTEAITADPERFAERADAFQGLDPTYVRALLHGLDNALREKRAFEWDAVLTLGAWLVEQPVGSDHSEEGAFLDRDNDARPARKALVSLLKRGLSRRDAGTISHAERERVWALISRVAEDPNPSPEYEKRWGGQNMDPATLALNTVRPSAISAAIEYAFWINHHANDRKEPVGMEEVPELRNLLERSLDPTQDPSPAVRAAIGQELGRLVWMDPDWVRGLREQLFPQDGQLLPLRLALFDTFLKYGWENPNVVRTVPEEYQAAILRAGIDRGTRHFGDEPDERLGDHLMTLYWSGIIPLHGEPGLIESFFREVPDGFRKRAIHFIGWSLFRTEKPVDVDPLERLSEFWDWRTAALHDQIAGGGNGAARSELSEFGWWFASRAFAPEWALPHLQDVLRLQGSIEWDHEVVAYLADLADEHPRDVLNTLALFDPTADGEIRNVHHWLQHARTIFQRCLEDEDPAVRESAIMLINRWVARGHLGLRDLLGTGNGDD